MKENQIVQAGVGRKFQTPSIYDDLTVFENLEISYPRGRSVYWVGSAGAGQDAGPGTDFDAIAQGFASITPLQIDLTRHAALPELERWLKLE